MKEYILASDEYTTIIFRTNNDEPFEPEDLIGLLSENEIQRMDENYKNKHHETIYI